MCIRLMLLTHLRGHQCCEAEDGQIMRLGMGGRLYGVNIVYLCMFQLVSNNDR